MLCNHAVHLELVTALSTKAFLSALRRFVARRGKPFRIFSDNGRNFLGAHSVLKDLGVFLKEQQLRLGNLYTEEGIQWTFIPAYSPHFGGLWEVGIKSVKFHLKWPVGKALLPFEDFSSILCQIEGILNSRPLTPFSSDPFDFEALTPSHFLIGQRLTSPPDPSVLEIPKNRLSHYPKLQEIHQIVWKRWSIEYVNGLQKRVKWKLSSNQMQPNSLVLIKEDNIPPLSWRMGRIVNLHPGTDGVARVATIQTSDGVIKRTFAKLCPLPIVNEN